MNKIFKKMCGNAPIRSFWEGQTPDGHKITGQRITVNAGHGIYLWKYKIYYEKLGYAIETDKYGIWNLYPDTKPKDEKHPENPTWIKCNLYGEQIGDKIRFGEMHPMG